MTFKAHCLALGASQWGKTTTHNDVHRRWPGVSLFVNTNDTPDMWGYRVHNLANLAQLVTRADGKINWIPPEDPETREVQLQAAVKKFAAWGGAERPKWDQPWCKLTVDEATGYEDSPGSPMHFVATRGLGRYGMSLTAICQNPTPMSTELRTNLTTRTVHNPGDEGMAFLRSKGYPGDAIQAWASRRDAGGKPLYNWCLQAREQWFRVRGRAAA